MRQAPDVDIGGLRCGVGAGRRRSVLSPAALAAYVIVAPGTSCA